MWSMASQEDNTELCHKWPPVKLHVCHVHLEIYVRDISFCLRGGFQCFDCLLLRLFRRSVDAPWKNSATKMRKRFHWVSFTYSDFMTCKSMELLFKCQSIYLGIIFTCKSECKLLSLFRSRKTFNQTTLHNLADVKSTFVSFNLPYIYLLWNRRRPDLARFDGEIMDLFSSRSHREEEEVSLLGWSWKGCSGFEFRRKKRHTCCDWSRIPPDRSDKPSLRSKKGVTVGAFHLGKKTGNFGGSKSEISDW